MHWPSRPVFPGYTCLKTNNKTTKNLGKNGETLVEHLCDGLVQILACGHIAQILLNGIDELFRLVKLRTQKTQKM